MHFTLDNSVYRAEKTCPLLRLDNLVAVPNKLMIMRCTLHSTTCPLVEVVYIFFHSYHVVSIGGDCYNSYNGSVL